MTSSSAPSRYRWVVLAVGAGATAALSAVQGGLPALGPAIQGTFGLALVVGALGLIAGLAALFLGRRRAGVGAA